jgi:hypothetical protein
MRITVGALAAGLLGLVLSAVGGAAHPYAVVVAFAAFGALVAFAAIGRPPSERLTVELLLAVNGAVFVLLYARSLPWPAVVALFGADAFYAWRVLRAHRAGSALAAWRSARARLHPSLALEEAQQQRAGGNHAADAEDEERPRRRDALGHEPAEVHAEEAGDE